MNILGNKIKQERIKLNLTRENLAEKIGVSYSTIAMYEQGNREPNNETIKKICEIFNCSIDYLFGKTLYKNRDEFQNEFNIMINEIKNFSKDINSKISNLALEISKQKLNEEQFFQTLEQKCLEIPYEYRYTCKLLSKYLYDEKLHNTKNVTFIDSFFDDTVQQLNDRIPLIYNITFKNDSYIVDNYENYINVSFKLDKSKEYFAYQIQNEEMFPLLGIDDIAIIEKCTDYENYKTYLISLDKKLILIRKIVINNDGIELQAMNPYYPIIKLTNNEIKERNFIIIGKVIKAENKSAFE